MYGTITFGKKPVHNTVFNFDEELKEAFLTYYTPYSKLKILTDLGGKYPYLCFIAEGNPPLHKIFVCKFYNIEIKFVSKEDLVKHKDCVIQYTVSYEHLERRYFFDEECLL